MGDYGLPHELVVEHTEQGLVDPDPQEEGEHEIYEFTVHYLLRHPADGCWAPGEERHECPITNEIENVGIEDALGIRTSDAHMRDGLYSVIAWAERYIGPEGEDWNGGLRVEVAKA